MFCSMTRRSTIPFSHSLPELRRACSGLSAAGAFSRRRYLTICVGDGLIKAASRQSLEGPPHRSIPDKTGDQAAAISRGGTVSLTAGRSAEKPSLAKSSARHASLPDSVR